MDWNFIIDFVKSYWRELLSVCSVFCSLLLFFFGRRYKTSIDEIKESVFEMLPTFICKVEESGHGCEKKSAVIELIKLYVKKTFHFELNDKLIKFFSVAIENILSTPQKKER